MGKIEEQYLQHQRQSHEVQSGGSWGFLCQGCSMVLQRLVNQFNFKCCFVLILSLSALLSGIFWVVPRYTIKLGFDANEETKLSATVQAYFRLEKPVSQLIPYIERLEYDINTEIGVPNTKVAVLSMHQSGASNWTGVVFGFLSDPMNVPIYPVSLSVLRSSFIELFLRESNLTLTASIFGNVSMFEILRFYDGLTVIPLQSASIIWQMPQTLFNFTLNNSMSEILDNFDDFKEELESGLNLSPYENVYVQLTNINGSTVDPPVIVQASVMSDFGGLLPQRLKQLAQTITSSPAKNLGLNNSVFGQVKEVSLSSFLEGTLHASPPSPSPAPSPQLLGYAEPSISPYHSPSYPPASSPTVNHPPCFDCEVSSPPPLLGYAEPSISPYHSPSYPPASSPTVNHPPCFDCEVSSPAPSVVIEHPPDPCPYSGFKYPLRSSPPTAAAPASNSATATVSPDLLPGSKPSQRKGRTRKLVSPSLSPSPL